jgi:hypothetical protein
MNKPVIGCHAPAHDVSGFAKMFHAQGFMQQKGGRQHTAGFPTSFAAPALPRCFRRISGVNTSFNPTFNGWHGHCLEEICNGKYSLNDDVSSELNAGRRN